MNLKRTEFIIEIKGLQVETNVLFSFRFYFDSLIADKYLEQGNKK
jgi:hypothetical protein